ncbi:hypothetical protein KY308_00430, partial [Candidatus Woesearchaeota archaeon]|nr:hypothetical protein [Candidatus Woesearchaeota archaeon]
MAIEKNKIIDATDIDRRRFKFVEIANKMVSIAPKSQAGFVRDINTEIAKLRKAMIGVAQAVETEIPQVLEASKSEVTDSLRKLSEERRSIKGALESYKTKVITKLTG